MSPGMPEITPQKAPGTPLTGQTGRDPSGGQGQDKAIREAYGEKERKTKAPQIAAAAKCVCCEGEFRQRWTWQKCCSRDCQLIYLAARTFLEAYREGRADGLRDVIEELKRA